MKNVEIGKNVIKKELPIIPKLPGIYRMLNEKNEILYIGKAKNIPNRLKSYVSEKNHIIRTERMLSQTRKIEITTTSNESEALLLEANLIKKHKPKFNILLRDDKSFPFIYIFPFKTLLAWRDYRLIIIDLHFYFLIFINLVLH